MFNYLVVILFFVTMRSLVAQEIVAPIPCIDEGTTVEFQTSGSASGSMMDKWKIRFLDYGTSNYDVPNRELGRITLLVPEVLNPPDSKTGMTHSEETEKREFIFKEDGKWYVERSAIEPSYSENLQRTYWDWGNKKLVTENQIEIGIVDSNLQIKSADGKMMVLVSGAVSPSLPPVVSSNGQITASLKDGMISLTVTRNQVLEGTLHYRVGASTPIGRAISMLGISEARRFGVSIPSGYGTDHPIVYNRNENCKAPTVPVSVLLRKGR
ncbi:MAG: hypothetical protein JWQ35_2295 [Bacteriovoracaceae bacterium]|nr:hypothetical protein [Bacteriovoracaceae bacterium]